jgi:hypothetical protein
MIICYKAVYAMVRSMVTKNRNLAGGTVEQRCRSRYGMCTMLVHRLWHELLDSKLMPEKGTVFNLLMALEFLKSYGTITSTATLYKVSDLTYTKWVWLYVEAISRMTHLVSTG